MGATIVMFELVRKYYEFHIIWEMMELHMTIMIGNGFFIKFYYHFDFQRSRGRGGWGLWESDVKKFLLDFLSINFLNFRFTFYW